MNHTFQSNPNSPDKCMDCAYSEELHGDNAECQSCNNHGTLNPFGLGNTQALLCRDCIARETAFIMDAAEAYQTPELQEARLAAYNKVANPYNELIRNARKIDEQIHLSTDIFNAKTVAFTDIRDAIWSNDEILPENKHFELARFCKERIAHFQSVIFDLDKKKIEAYSEQKAWHLSLNTLANSLRLEEREQLRVNDITYDVKMPKAVTPRTIKIAPKKASKEELRK